MHALRAPSSGNPDSWGLSSGRGCDQPSRSAQGLERAALLGLRLIGHDQRLQEAVRAELRRAAGPGPQERHGRTPDALPRLRDNRRKLLELHYADKISADLFAEQEAELTAHIHALEGRASQLHLACGRSVRQLALGGQAGFSPLPPGDSLR